MMIVLLPATVPAKDLTITVFDLKPWGQIDEKGNVTGVTVDFFEAISKESGLEFSYELQPYKRMLVALEHQPKLGSIFFISSYSKKIAEPVIHVHNEENIAIGLKGTDLLHPEDLATVKLATPRSVSYGPLIDDNPDLQRELTRNHSHSIRLLLAGRVDAIVGPRRAIMLNLAKNGVKPHDLGTSLTLGEKEAWLQVSKGLADAHKKRLSRAITRLKDRGTFDEILNQYFLTPLKLVQLDRSDQQ